MKTNAPLCGTCHRDSTGVGMALLEHEVYDQGLWTASGPCEVFDTQGPHSVQFQKTHGAQPTACEEAQSDWGLI